MKGCQLANILEIQEKVSQVGGKLQIPDTDVSLEIPADTLDQARDYCLIQMRILPTHCYEKYCTSFSSNSTVAVELLPNNLKLKHPVQLTLPHCLKLKKDVEYKAKIFMSHHERNADLHWEETTDQPYILDETACTIWLNKFCWVKYEIDDKIVEAKKIKIFTAAKQLCLPDNIAEIEVGYYLDLPGAGEFLQQNPDFVLAQRKSFLFLKEGKFPMKVSLQRVLPSTWHHSAPEENEIPFQTVASSIEYSCPFVLEQVTKGSDVPICTFTASQHQRHLEINVRPKV
ncbi:Netrin receptor UNC5B [Holothuria leucospilota]|uniref:Netrin receptor UNC5B n=1 Tax=Holothuria leucospilota TaxID=206669 RepID=A0A9Q1BXK4_HOLLE|nr:Netrin receptor UNC5B [Holothuria leucospilota]